jgi:hypothetical protein
MVTGGMFLFGQCSKNFSSRLFPWKPTTSQLCFNAPHSAIPLKLGPSNGDVVAIPRNGLANKSGVHGSSWRTNWRTKHRKKPNMPNDSHQRAAEFHELAAHAHRAAAVHRGKEDHQTGHEHSKQAMEHAKKAMEWTQEAHRKSKEEVEKA